MKTILVPTDFSATSLNALDYAAGLALQTKSKLFLFHVYDNAPPALDVPAIIPSLEHMEQDSMRELQKIKKKLEIKYNQNLVIRCVCKWGFKVEEINKFARENNVDLIVMGVEETGYLTERFFGSATTTLMRKSFCPVLSIHEGVIFKEIKKITLACDYIPLERYSILEPLKKLASILGAHISVLDIANKMELHSSVDNTMQCDEIDYELGSINHSYHHSYNISIIKGINDFVNENDIDLVVMIPHNHSVISRIFHESETKRMAFHSKVPLLALHE